MFVDRINKDVLAGLFFVAAGVLLGSSAMSLPFGSSRSLGPGYFPVLLSGLLALLGGVLFVRGILAGSSRAEQPMALRDWLPVAATPIAAVLFGLTIRPLGLVPATAIAAVVTIAPCRNYNLLSLTAMATALTVISCLIFVWALGLPWPLFGNWLR